MSKSSLLHPLQLNSSPFNPLLLTFPQTIPVLFLISAPLTQLWMSLKSNPSMHFVSYLHYRRVSNKKFNIGLPNTNKTDSKGGFFLWFKVTILFCWFLLGYFFSSELVCHLISSFYAPKWWLFQPYVYQHISLISCLSKVFETILRCECNAAVRIYIWFNCFLMVIIKNFKLCVLNGHKRKVTWEKLAEDTSWTGQYS